MSAATDVSSAIKEQKGVVRLLSSLLVALGVFTGAMIIMIIGVVKNKLVSAVMYYKLAIIPLCLTFPLFLSKVLP